MKIIVAADKNWGIGKDNKPVSYTHLDVYKRQRYDCGTVDQLPKLCKSVYQAV